MSAYKSLLSTKRNLESTITRCTAELQGAKDTIAIIDQCLERLKPGSAAKAVESADQLLTPVAAIIAELGPCPATTIRSQLKKRHGLKAPKFALDKALSVLQDSGAILFCPTPQGDPAWRAA